MQDDDNIKIRNQEMLKSGALFINDLPPPFAHSNNEAKESNSAKFHYYFGEMRNTVKTMLQELEDVLAEIMADQEKHSLLEPFYEGHKWKKLVKDAYEASTKLWQVLREETDKCKRDCMVSGGMSTNEAETTARKKYPQLALIEDFRSKAAACLNINPKRARA